MNYTLKTTKNYTNKDTLYYSKNGDPFFLWKKIAGPFVNNMIFDSISNTNLSYYQELYEPHINPKYVEIKFWDHAKDTLLGVWSPTPTIDICDTHTDLVFELP